MRLMAWKGNGEERTAGVEAKSIGQGGHLFHCASHIPITDLVRFADERREKRLVAKIVYDAWNSAAAPVDGTQRPARKARAAVATGERQTMMNLSLIHISEPT